MLSVLTDNPQFSTIFLYIFYDSLLTCKTVPEKEREKALQLMRRSAFVVIGDSDSFRMSVILQ